LHFQFSIFFFVKRNFVCLGASVRNGKAETRHQALDAWYDIVQDDQQPENQGTYWLVVTRNSFCLPLTILVPYCTVTKGILARANIYILYSQATRIPDRLRHGCFKRKQEYATDREGRKRGRPAVILSPPESNGWDSAMVATTPVRLLHAWVQSLRKDVLNLTALAPKAPFLSFFFHFFSFSLPPARATL
jgi:hypothetical protein